MLLFWKNRFESLCVAQFALIAAIDLTAIKVLNLSSGVAFGLFLVAMFGGMACAVAYIEHLFSQASQERWIDVLVFRTALEEIAQKGGSLGPQYAQEFWDSQVRAARDDVRMGVDEVARKSPQKRRGAAIFVPMVLAPLFSLAVAVGLSLAM